MKALVVVFSVLIAGAAAAQDRVSALDKAYEEARAAALALNLEHEVEMARRRYDAALKRWNDLK